MSNSLDKVKREFISIITIVNEKLGKDYATKNPGLVQHLLDKVQQEEDREITRKLNKIV